MFPWKARRDAAHVRPGVMLVHHVAACRLVAIQVRQAKVHQAAQLIGLDFPGQFVHEGAVFLNALARLHHQLALFAKQRSKLHEQIQNESCNVL